MCTISFPDKYKGIFEPHRYKVYYGGRGSGKTEQIATWLLLQSLSDRFIILCCREYQTSIKNSVHAVLVNAIRRLNLEQYFTINNDSITSHTGSKFIFAGLYNNIDNIKSIPNIKYCWVEEAQTISQHSLNVLLPTIRGNDSEIVFSFNPYYDDDPIYKMFVINKPENALVVKTSYADNPFFPQVLQDELEQCRNNDYETYEHVWEGECIKHSEAQIFNGKYKLQVFEPQKHWHGPYYGIDWGFAKDPTTLIKSWICDNILYIEQEAYGIGIDINDLPKFFSSIEPECNKYTIRADNARPETISYMKQHGYPGIVSCKKWPGSIEDGIAYLRTFKEIIIHPKCQYTLKEFKMYSYKVDTKSGDILPIIAPGYDHIIDALRYSHEPMITKRKQNTMRII